ncbi:PREDICTED: slit homolog 2 protein-like [Branchiostoma belcheri]|uniref:Slit homolog 2 protein-like n=1 Tax=Branchiostoma belcheri TaxID=7741 RepID=A0A6P4XJE7_BRABE|nr:PREDICTED: slit homolog 2 protein-like [Branchiostoma belcheri]
MDWEDNMGRKLRHWLIFLIIILKEPHMRVNGDCNCSGWAYICKCKGMGLKSIPQNLPATFMTVLDLSNNQIPTLNHSALGMLKRLNDLKLHTLHLSVNKITSITTGALSNLPGLSALRLIGNQITSIELGIASGTFSGLPHLQDLTLSYNQITSINPHAFSNLTRFQRLYLSNNQIWANAIVGKGYRGRLENEDLYPLKDKDTSLVVTNEFRPYWERELKKSTPKKPPSLSKAIIRCYGLRYFLVGFVKLFDDTLTLVKPILIGYIIKYFEPSSGMTLTDAYMYAGILAGLQVFQVIIGYYEWPATLFAIKHGRPLKDLNGPSQQHSCRRCARLQEVLLKQRNG